MSPPIQDQQPDVPQGPPRRFVDMQLSLSSIISGVVTVATFMLWMGWQAAQQTSNSVQLQLGITKIERRLDTIDTSNGAQRETVLDLRSEQRMHAMKIDELARQLKELQGRR